jgi:hypothetical protein
LVKPSQQFSWSATTRQRRAVYTQVPIEYGLDQEFNSLDAQHEAAEAYIRGQAHDGWTPISTRYDDDRYSGGSTERPALQRLLADIRDHRIDIVVVYKVERVTRSLADFAKLVELFDAHGIAIVPPVGSRQWSIALTLMKATMLRDDIDELILTEDTAYILGVEFKPDYFEEYPSALQFMSIFSDHEAFDRAVALTNLLNKTEAIGVARAMSGNLDDESDAVRINAEQARLLHVEFRPTESIKGLPTCSSDPGTGCTAAQNL